tara:strand:+ start:130 stop:411 length:282 start_codon:yes stop_codon:yes gene_type:complete
MFIVRRSTSADDTQQCIFAYRYHETIGKTGCRPSSQSQPKMVHDGLQALRAPAVPGQDVVIEPLAENAAPAEDTITPKSTRQDRELYPPASKG